MGLYTIISFFCEQVGVVLVVCASDETIGHPPFEQATLEALRQAPICRPSFPNIDLKLVNQGCSFLERLQKCCVLSNCRPVVS